MEKKNNLSFTEIVKFLVKPTRNQIGSNYIEKIEKGEHYLVSFKNVPNKLFWPVEFDPKSIYQVTSETFDLNDWHYYRKEKTPIEDGDILLDIGTAEGLFPLVVAEKCKKIFLIEPSKLFVECLQKTFEPYKEKIIIHNVVVGDEDGMINFNEESLSGKIGENNHKNDTQIAIKKIDSLISEDETITYLKADIEGFEYEMLKGAKNTIKKNKPKIAITTYHKENNPSEIIDLILSYVPEYKYYVKGIFEQGPKPVDRKSVV